MDRDTEMLADVEIEPLQESAASGEQQAALSNVGK